MYLRHDSNKGYANLFLVTCKNQPYRCFKYLIKVSVQRRKCTPKNNIGNYKKMVYVSCFPDAAQDLFQILDYYLPFYILYKKSLGGHWTELNSNYTKLFF